MNIQKIAENNIQPYGARGMSVSIPKIYASDNGLERGDALEIYRTQIDGRDALVLIPKKATQEPAKTQLAENEAQILFSNSKEGIVR